MQNRIPKVIHYCWFSEDKKPKEIQRCIRSWSRIMPDYTIKCWTSKDFDMESVDYVKEAISAKKWAFVTDYIRLYALYTEGGIYLDSDVEVFKPFDTFLSNHFFCGTEAFDYAGTIKFDMEAAIMGAENGHPFVKECMNYYENTSFIKKDGKYDTTVMPQVISRIAASYGYQYKDQKQELCNNVTVYPTDIFINNLYLAQSHSQNHYALHRNAAGWMEFEHRGKLFHFCRKHDLMNLYHLLEKYHK